MADIDDKGFRKGVKRIDEGIDKFKGLKGMIMDIDKKEKDLEI